MLFGEENVKSRVFSSLLISAMLILNFLIEYHLSYGENPLITTESNSLSKGDNNMNDPFTVKFDVASSKLQISLNLKAIFSADSALTL